MVLTATAQMQVFLLQNKRLALATTEGLQASEHVSSCKQTPGQRLMMARQTWTRQMRLQIYQMGQMRMLILLSLQMQMKSLAAESEPDR